MAELSINKRALGSDVINRQVDESIGVSSSVSPFGVIGKNKIGIDSKLNDSSKSSDNPFKIAGSVTSVISQASQIANNSSSINQIDEQSVDNIEDENYQGEIYKTRKSPKNLSSYINRTYNKYYSASDFVIRVRGNGGDPVWLDKASGVAVNESLSSTPIYTLGDSRVNFFSRGNLLVSGFISVNMVSADYMSKVLAVINGAAKSFKYLTAREQLALTPEKLRQYLKEKEEFETQEIESMSTLGYSDYGLFTIELIYNNSDAISRVTAFSREILECRIVGFEQGIDIGGDGQLVDGYRFIAKEII